jgi:hypothetical protein
MHANANFGSHPTDPAFIDESISRQEVQFSMRLRIIARFPFIENPNGETEITNVNQLQTMRI